MSASSEPGGVSMFHYEGYVAGGATVVAIADINPLALAKRQREWNIPKGYSSYQELLADPSIEAVFGVFAQRAAPSGHVSGGEGRENTFCAKNPYRSRSSRAKR